jgi:dephospho-CoA kinase
VSGIFSHLGIPVYYADERARKLMETSAEIRTQLVALLGAEVYHGKYLNRSLLAQAIFYDDDLREAVNAIVHPVVFRDFVTWSERFPGKPYVIQEAAIIFESGADRLLDRVINVYAPVKVRVDRIVRRDGLAPDAVKARIRSQMSEKERQRRASFTIVNDGNRMVVPQVIKVHEELIS